MKTRAKNSDKRAAIVFGLFSNACYEILGFSFRKRIYGICIKTMHPPVIAGRQFVNLPEYHLKTDTEPQFQKIRTRLFRRSEK